MYLMIVAIIFKKGEVKVGDFLGLIAPGIVINKNKNDIQEQPQ